MVNVYKRAWIGPPDRASLYNLLMPPPSECCQQCKLMVLTEYIKHHFYVKHQMWICTTWVSFLHLLVVYSCLVFNSCCFYLLIFYFEKFSTWIWYCLLFAIYVKLKPLFKLHLDVGCDCLSLIRNSSWGILWGSQEGVAVESWLMEFVTTDVWWQAGRFQ